ncbi:armadillo-type protein [Pelagophyceae sp. CCMP2097]|nr:armadillo-type protein [Pelagophyceae sp. CCMP2097]|mmetsp:Transcript_28311/g.95320  ORF Transcript_28311/g.95320 Transcript_28311/m.95320 type:complete len:1046 (+) Transcript_28311:102-3239(+)
MEASGAELFSALRANLDAMYLGTRADDRRSADRWLQKLQRESAGWGVANALLSGTTDLAPLNDPQKPLAREALVFAAITLDVKVCGDLHELSPEQQVELRSATLEHLARWGCTVEVAPPPALLKKLSLAVAALAVQTSWEGVLTYVAERVLAPALAEGANFAQACRAARVALEILAALPEQCAQKALSVARPRREAYARFLCASSDGALGLVMSVAAWAQHAVLQAHAVTQAHPGAVDPHVLAAQLNESVFACLESWIRSCDVPADKLASNALFLGCFDAFNHPQLFDVAADVVVETLRTYDCRDERNMPLVAVVAPRVMALRPRFEAATLAEDDDVALGLCRLFVEMAEAYMPLIASAMDVNQLVIVDLVLLCTDHPSRGVAQVPLRFWYHLARSWGRLANDGEDGAKRRLHALLAPLFAKLARTSVRQCRRTEDDGFEGEAPRTGRGGAARDDDDFSRHRAELFETLGDCAFFLGADVCLEELASELSLAISADTDGVAAADGRAKAPPCDGVEACLFALRALSTFVPVTEDTVIPHTMRLILQLPAEWPSARASAAALVGAYAQWISTHPEFLQPLFQFLLQQLDVPALNPASSALAPGASTKPPAAGGPASVAANAIKRVCDACRSQLGEPVLALRDSISGGVLNLKDELEILEGLGHIISALPDYDAVRRGTEKLAAPPAVALAALAASPGTPEPKLVIAELERLTSVVRCALPGRDVLESLGPAMHHPVLVLVDRLWPVFETIADRYRHASHVVEKLCRCYKHAMRTCRRHFEPMLQRMIVHLVGHFQHQPLCSYLYAASICITEFCGDDAKVPMLFDMLSSFSASIFALLKTLQDFVQHPDVVEEYFYLVARFLSYCPDPLVGSPLLGEVLRCGVVGLRLEHREAHQGVLHCFERTVSTALCGAPGHRSAEGPAAPASEERMHHHRTLLFKLFVQDGLGEQIAVGVLGALTGDLPAYALDEGHGSLIGVLWKLRLFCPQQLTQWVAASLTALSARLASNEVKADLMALVVKDPPSKDEFYEGFLVFSARCREIVNVLR